MKEIVIFFDDKGRIQQAKAGDGIWAGETLEKFYQEARVLVKNQPVAPTLDETEIVIKPKGRIYWKIEKAKLRKIG